MKCPKCNMENAEVSSVCSNCGAPLSLPTISLYPSAEAYGPESLDFKLGAVLDGKYRLLQEIGSGGMGIVYQADQTEPFHRRVAVKIIKIGMDTRQVVARFEAERQALAVMDHPNIAKAFDAGVTATGRPYFVMEFISGIPITAYCDEYKLSMRQRLELFIPVCQAVQHAHQKGVIHRDLKPSNVLVTVNEGQAVPKIIDFGIARATEHHLAQQTIFTEQGQMIGTPEYMSPEQAEMSGLDIDTRTDIYSLGVMLYELLIGVLPFEPKELRRAGYAAIQRIIRETEPPKASTRLGALKATQSEIAEKRKTDLDTLLRELRGDLDWITTKAMDKDRTRRYESASGFAADIRHYLSNEPVIARPPSATYKIAKFAKRHKAGLGAGVLTAAALIVGLMLALMGLIRARRAEVRANQEAQTSTQVSDFLVRMFEISDPGGARGNKLTARAILDGGASKIRSELKDQPLVQARLMSTMGKVYRNLGLYAAARPLLEDALKIQGEHLGPDHPDVATSLNNLAVLYGNQGKYDQAEPLYKRALAVREKALGPDHPDVAASLNNLATLYTTQGRYAEAEPLLKRSLAVREKALGPDHPSVAESLHNLAAIYDKQGRYAEAEPLFKRSLAIHEKALGPDHPNVAASLHYLATLYTTQGRYAEAEPLLKRSLAIREKVLGPDHPDVAASLDSLALLYTTQGRYAEAEPLYKRSLAIWEKALGPDHPNVAMSLNNLALLYDNQGRYAEAEPLLKRSLAVREKALGPDHPDVAMSLNNLALLYDKQGRYAEAEPLLKRSLAVREKALGPDHPNVAASLLYLAALYRAQGRYAEAEPLLKRSLAVREKALGPDHPNVAASLLYLAALYTTQGRYAEAEPLYKRSLAIWEKALGPDHPNVAMSLNNLALLYRATKREKEAQELEARAARIRAIKR
jgi:serine/threonine protein kinase/Flp pilus assembly protein TadD